MAPKGIPRELADGAMVLMHRDDGTAYTRFVDKKKREWEVRMARDQYRRSPDARIVPVAAGRKAGTRPPARVRRAGQVA